MNNNYQNKLYFFCYAYKYLDTFLSFKKIEEKKMHNQK